MRYLIVSDLHSNWEALQAVLEDASGQYDRIVCCGDLVGYGPDPNRVVDWARATLDNVIRGNHDKGCAGLENLEWFNPVARTANIWSAAQLSSKNLTWLRELPAGPLNIDGFQLVHGSPFDEDEYLMSVEDVHAVFAKLDTITVFFGHTHQQGTFAHRHGWFEVFRRSDVSLRLDTDAAWLVNPGSVGQPRDGDPRAAYALFDSATRELLQCRVRYDYQTTAGKIMAAGLPDVLAARLSVGR